MSVPMETQTRQRMDALQQANRVRTARSGLKNDFRAGRRNPVSLIADPPEWVEGMQVAELLLAIPRLGTVKVERILRRLDVVSSSRTLASLSARQRERLLVELGGLSWLAGDEETAA